MSQFYDNASLVVVPSGYKAGTVYAQKPLTTDGQLAFTRTGDTATRVNSAGLIEKVRTNRVLRSETLDNAYWTKVNVSITANSIANPLDGALTADLLTVTDPSGPVEKTITTGTTQSFTAGTPYTISAYYKAATVTSTFRILAYDGTTIYTSGTIDLATIGNSTASYVSVGNGWYRFRFTFTPANSTAAGIVYLVNYQYGVAVTAGTNVYVYGTQVELGDIATAYIPTTTAAVSVGMVANTPRLDFLGSTCPRLLLEPQRTNLVTFSEQFNNAAWTKQEVTVTANAAISPDGYTNADNIVPTAVSGTHQVFTGALVTSSQCAMSVYAKANGYTTFQMLDRTNGANGALFNLANGTVTNTGSGVGTITSVGNGWYRCTAVATTTGIRFYVPTSSGTFTGDGTSGVLLWGAQLEAGAYATSYIPTLAATATRGADACSKTGISSLIGQTEGTVFVEFKRVPKGVNYQAVVTLQGASASYLIEMYFGSANTLTAAVYNAGAQFQAATSALSEGTYKAALAYKENDFAFYVNGVQISTDNSGTVPALSTYNLGDFSYLAGYPQADGINQALLFKTRLTNAELAELTTL